MNSLAKQRNELKSRLSRERIELYFGRYRPICAYCLLAINGAPDMHEVIITRGDIQGAPHLAPLIMVRENCVLIHQRCHWKANTKTGMRRCIRHLLAREGYCEVHSFLLNLDDKMKGTQAKEALRLIKEINRGKN